MSIFYRFISKSYMFRHLFTAKPKLKTIVIGNSWYTGFYHYYWRNAWKYWDVWLQTLWAVLIMLYKEFLSDSRSVKSTVKYNRISLHCPKQCNCANLTFNFKQCLLQGTHNKYSVSTWGNITQNLKEFKFRLKFSRAV